MTNKKFSKRKSSSSRLSTSRSISTLSLLLSLIVTLKNFSFVDSTADAHRRDDFSFRGPVPEELHLPHWDISGTTHRIPSAKDFIRLVHPFPLAYGGMFTQKPIPFDQWSVEIAFRVHGGYSGVHHNHHNNSHRDPLDDDDVLGKGGRGLAFWYTKTANPTPPTIPANPHHHKVPPPSLTVAPFPDPLDDRVSFFGGPVSFDGLAVVIDNQPSIPLTRRSDRRHWGPEDGGSGAEEWAVVSGVVDHGKGKSTWLEDITYAESDEDDEAAYLNHTIGDCQVALRNAAGMVWMKVTHIEGHLKVYLDLQPHTTLSGHERNYDRECFSASNIKLPRNYYMGLTGLASPNEEADNIDIYAIEVKEIKGYAKKEEDVKEHYKEEHVAADDVKLQGTSKKSDHDSMATETINNQRIWADEVKKMSQKLAALSKERGEEQLFPPAGKSPGGGSPGNGSPGMGPSPLEVMNRKLDSIMAKISHSGGNFGQGHSMGSESEILKKIGELEERTTKHEMFLSEQIEQLRYLILYPQAYAHQREDHHFKPLESLHDSPNPDAPTPLDGHHPSPEHNQQHHEEPFNYDHYFESDNHHQGHSKRSMLNFLSWTVGICLILWILYQYGYKQFRSNGGSNRFDEGSFGGVGGSGSGGSYNPVSATMDAFGFRQRSKKMI